jgi:cell division protease FtsH
MRPGWSRFWWLLIALLLVNWVVASLMLGAAPRTNVSYTFFAAQVDAANVKEITSTGDTIEGELKQKVAYPPDTPDAEQVDRFTTQRPSFATDDLFAPVDGKRRPGERQPTRPASPAMAAVAGRIRPDAAVCGDCCCGSCAVAPGGVGGLGGFGRSRARRFEPGTGPRNHVR